jgi:hypothetical protein
MNALTDYNAARYSAAGRGERLFKGSMAEGGRGRRPSLRCGRNDDNR